MKTPVYIISEKKLKQNLEVFKKLKEKCGCKVILALKAYAAFATFPLIKQYLDGCTSSSLHEAKLGRETFDKDVHIYSPAYKKNEIDDIIEVADHIIFNSHSQLTTYKEYVKNKRPNIQIGLRLNPEHSEVDVDIYNPCSQYSRFGVTLRELKEDDLKDIDGFLVHNLCGQGIDALKRTIESIENKFGPLLHTVNWLNLGGGHLITNPKYDTNKLADLITKLQNKYNIQIILEPGEAIVLRAGTLVVEVLDIIKNEKEIAIIDSSATAHMPDVLEMPYRPDIETAGQADEYEYTYKIGAVTCLSGDIIGDYSFKKPLKIGDRLTFLDMAQYTMVKNTTFNGLNLPSIAIKKCDGTLEIIKEFGYKDFKNRLS
jgi:carboxynorspermidine decarboxylase